MSEQVIRILPLLYFCWALAFGLILAMVTPPWQNPDEPNHFMRAVQISEGGITGEQFGDRVGGTIEASISSAVAPFEPLKFHSQTKATFDMFVAARGAAWGGIRENVAFGNTAINPPIFYVADIVAIWIGKHINLSVIATLVLARSVNVLTFACVVAFALFHARRTRLAIAAVATLPMTVALSASVSQDGLMLAFTALAVAMLDRMADEGRECKSGEMGWIAVVMSCLAMARPPYLFLLGLLFLTTTNKRSQPYAALAVCMGIVCTMAWGALSPPLDGASYQNPVPQIEYLKHHPSAIVQIAKMTLLLYGPIYLQQFVGVLGWLDTFLPTFVIYISVVVLLLSFLSSSSGPSRLSWLAAALAVASCGAIEFSEYLTYTAPGISFVVGSQGRHFLPLAMVLPLAVPHLPRLGALTRPVAVTALIGFMGIIPFIVIPVVTARYYAIPG
jgi:uncharacterized membrane protein